MTLLKRLAEAVSQAAEAPPPTESKLTALETIEEARKLFGPIYLGGSRRMQQRTCEGSTQRTVDTYDEKDVAITSQMLAKSDIIESMMIYLKPTTDYDFYATYSNELTNFLLANNFRGTTSMDDENWHDDAEPVCWYDLDNEAIHIMVRDATDDEPSVQVVLRKDAEFYKAVFDNITPEFYVDYLWKSSGKPTVVKENIQPIMNMLFTIGRAAQAIPKKE